MGQRVGRMPDTWSDILEEKERVLHWSGEVLSRVNENVVAEDGFLAEYDNDAIEAKVTRWMLRAPSWAELTENRRGLFDRALIKTGVEELKEAITGDMRRSYGRSYRPVSSLTKQVDKLGQAHRRIHKSIQCLEDRCCMMNAAKFNKTFGPLRRRVFDNLARGEKMLHAERKLRRDFVKRVDEVDRKYKSKCWKGLERLSKEVARISAE